MSQNLSSAAVVIGDLRVKEHYKSQTVWIQISTDIMSVLIGVQTVCKGYLQTKKIVATKEKVNGYFHINKTLCQNYRIQCNYFWAMTCVSNNMAFWHE